jgi:hypothetical protein
MKRSALYFFVIFICCVVSANCTEFVEEDVNALRVVMQHGNPWLSARMVKSLAVNKICEKFLCETAPLRAACLIGEKISHRALDCVAWDKYGIVAGKVSYCYVPLTGNRSVRITRYSLDEGFRMYELWNNFYGYLPHRSQLQVTGNGLVRFYGYGETYENDPQSGWIMECCLRGNQPAMNFKCGTFVKQGKKKSYISLAMLLEFHHLLSAILNSSLVYEDVFGPKIYDLRGVTIPKNYKEFKPYFPQAKYKSFKDLPKNVRKTIERRYKKQCRKKIIGF